MPRHIAYALLAFAFVSVATPLIEPTRNLATALSRPDCRVLDGELPWGQLGQDRIVLPELRTVIAFEPVWHLPAPSRLTEGGFGVVRSALGHPDAG